MMAMLRTFMGGRYETQKMGSANGASSHEDPRTPGRPSDGSATAEPPFPPRKTPCGRGLPLAHYRWLLIERWTMVGKRCPLCDAEYELNQKFCPIDGAALRSSDLSAGLEGRIVGDRDILRRLGHGGMGEVYLARHVRMGRLDALKVMRSELAQNVDAVSRFNREATNASRINHPNVAVIYAVGDTEDGHPYMAMEYVEGSSLADLRAGSEPFAPVRVGNILRQIAAALHAAHELGIVHRDLKPENILIATKPAADTVKLVDFGISRVFGAEDQKVTTSGVVVGSPAYMSPEQVSAQPLDARSDIYS